jgi:ribonuclease HI
LTCNNAKGLHKASVQTKFPFHLLPEIRQMANSKAKWYVVLKGKQPGIYTDWPTAKAQVDGFPKPVYKSFESEKDAKEAWKNKKFPHQHGNGEMLLPGIDAPVVKMEPPSGPFVIVDASSLGVPGPTEYQGFLMPEKKLLFSKHIGLATNNIGEFLAIVHALALMYKHESPLPVYSDSATAISWVLKKKVKTSLERNAKTAEAWELVERGEKWLQTHLFTNRIRKWETEHWGENPADYGRK